MAPQSGHIQWQHNLPDHIFWRFHVEFWMVILHFPIGTSTVNRESILTLTLQSLRPNNNHLGEINKIWIIYSWLIPLCSRWCFFCSSYVLSELTLTHSHFIPKKHVRFYSSFQKHSVVNPIEHYPPLGVSINGGTPSLVIHFERWEFPMEITPRFWAPSRRPGTGIGMICEMLTSPWLLTQVIMYGILFNHVCMYKWYNYGILFNYDCVLCMYV